MNTALVLVTLILNWEPQTYTGEKALKKALHLAGSWQVAVMMLVTIEASRRHLGEAVNNNRVL